MPSITLGKSTVSIRIDTIAGNILTMSPDFADKVITEFIRLSKEVRTDLIFRQFINFPGESRQKVIIRSGAFIKSINERFVRNENGFKIFTYFDAKYQTIQPQNDATEITIIAKNKKFLAIPNPAVSELFDHGVYKYAGIDLKIGRKLNPAHPYAKRLIFKKRGDKAVLVDKANIRGRVFYFLVKSVTIKTKRPISKANQAYFNITQKLLDQAFERVFDEEFIHRKPVSQKSTKE